MRAALLAAIAAAFGANALLAPAFARATAGQQPAPPIFRVEVEAVEIDAFVTDAQGNPVTDLTVDDFELLEDGKPQTITSLALVNIPIEREERPLFSPTAIEPDVHSNQGPDGRLYVIALDEVPPQLALRTRHFMRRFLERHFAANDVAAIVLVTRGRGADTQDFTSNRRLLLAAVDRYSGGGLGATGRDRMRALRDLLEFMANLRGRRKTMIYITRGVGDVFGVLDYNGGVRSLEFDDLHAALTAATRGNVSIYPIDPAGLSPEGGFGEDESAPASDAGANLVRISDLRALADATGGFALVNSNSFDAAFTRIIRENSTYYVLGFTSTNDKRDGRYRRLQVRVKRPGLQVRSRDGYVAPLRRAATPAAPVPAHVLAQPVADAIGLPIANRALPMSVTAAAFKGTSKDANVVITIELDGSRLDLIEGGERMKGDIDVAAAAVSAAGRIFQGQRHRLNLALKPDTFAAARDRGFRVLLEQPLPPGRYQLRIAAGPVNGAVAGSVMADVDVPDFTKGPLVMSGVTVTSTSADALVTSAPKAPPLGTLLPSPPTAAREFARGETLTVYAEVYENLRNRAAHLVVLTTELRSDAGRVVHTVSEERSSKELGGRSGGYGFRAQLPLAAMEPGIYVIHLEGRANIGDRPTAARDIQIRVK